MAKLYVADRFPDHFIAEDEDLLGIFVIWPAIADGWSARALWRGNPRALREVRPRLAYGTGWPRAPGRGAVPRAGVAAGERITIRLTPGEIEQWRAAAGNRPLAEFIRASVHARVGLLTWTRSLLPHLGQPACVTEPADVGGSLLQVTSPACAG
jgi:hypothetical protein